jgi:CRISPR-associated protein Csd1
MSSLASLVRAYDRMAAHGKVPAYGFSRERIGFLIPLYPDGRVAHEPIDLRQGEGKKKTAPLMAVPASFKRPGVTPRSFFLWDNSAFALGVTASEGKDAYTRWRAFRERHLRDLLATQDEGLQALLNFIGGWTPEHFSEFGWPEDMKDQNIVFALESERLANIMIHDRARAVGAADCGGREDACCLPYHRRSCAGGTIASGHQGRLGRAIVRRLHRFLQSRRLRVVWP